MSICNAYNFRIVTFRLNPAAVLSSCHLPQPPNPAFSVCQNTRHTSASRRREIRGQSHSGPHWIQLPRRRMRIESDWKANAESTAAATPTRHAALRVGRVNCRRVSSPKSPVDSLSFLPNRARRFSPPFNPLPGYPRSKKASNFALNRPPWLPRSCAPTTSSSPAAGPLRTLTLGRSSAALSPASSGSGCRSRRKAPYTRKAQPWAGRALLGKQRKSTPGQGSRTRRPPARCRCLGSPWRRTRRRWANTWPPWPWGECFDWSRNLLLLLLPLVVLLGPFSPDQMECFPSAFFEGRRRKKDLIWGRNGRLVAVEGGSVLLFGFGLKSNKKNISI